MIQKQLGLENSGIASFTMQNSDLSFMLALEAGAAWLTTGRYENILVVSSEIFSLNLDENNPEVYGLFGDGAAAVIMHTPDGETSGIQYAQINTYSQSAPYIKSIMGLLASKQRDTKTEDSTLQMEAKSFKKYGNEYTHTLIDNMCQEKFLDIDNIGIVIPRQIGKFYTDHLQNKLGIPKEKIISIIDRLGFCGAASLPSALYNAVKEKKLKRGDRCLLLVSAPAYRWEG